MLPQLDGLGVIEAMRARGIATPVLVLSALGSVDDRIKGLKAGGDDYLTKPFAFAELLARIEALLRRHPSAPHATRLKVEDLEFDLLARRVTRGGREVDLTARELKLLEFLMRRAGQVVTRTMLLEGVWDLHFDPQSNLIDVHISRLRQAIDRGARAPPDPHRARHRLRAAQRHLAQRAPGPVQHHRLPPVGRLHAAGHARGRRDPRQRLPAHREPDHR